MGHMTEREALTAFQLHLLEVRHRMSKAYAILRNHGRSKDAEVLLSLTDNICHALNQLDYIAVHMARVMKEQEEESGS